MKKKMTRHCQVGDSADSMGSGANPEESSFFKVESKKIILQGLKPKVHYITGAKNTINPSF